MKDPEDYTASVLGVVSFNAIQGSTIYVYCNANGLDTNGPQGVALAVPASATANLEDLIAVTTDQVGTITASRAAVSNAAGTIVASTTTAAQILALASLTASRALVSDASGYVVHATTTSTQLNSLATLTAGSVPYLSATGVFAPTSGPGALIDSMGQPTYPNFTVKQTTASTLEDMIIVKNAAGTAVWAMDILANSNISFLDYVNNKNVMTLVAGATYTYLQLLSTAAINWAGTGTVGATSMGLSRVSTTALAVTGGATIAAGGAYRDLGLRQLLVNGTTSGVVTVTGAAVAGTWTLTLPADGGTSGYFLQTNGSGTTTWAAVTGGATAALDNLASVNINTSLLAQTGVDLGSTTKPFRDLYLFGSGTYATTYIKQTGTPTSTRTITWPDASGIPAISASALTSGRVPFATTGGLLTDSANFIYNGTTLALSGATISGSSATSFATITGTWNTSGVVLGALNVAVTSTASGTLSRIASFNVDGLEIAGIVKDGHVFAPGYWFSAAISFNGANAHGVSLLSSRFDYYLAGEYGFVMAGTSNVGASLSGLTARSDYGYKWSSTTNANGTKDTGINRNAAGVVEVNNGTSGTFASWIAKSGTYTMLDAVTNALTTIETIQHNSSGTPAASFGSRVLFNLHSTTTTNQNAGSVDVYWSTATHASRTSVVALCAVNNAAALAEVLTIRGDGLITPLDGSIMACGTTTGLKLGSSSSNKLGFLGATPIVQFATTGETTGFTANAGTATRHDSTYTGNVGSTAYTISDVVKAMKNFGLMAA